MGGRRARLPLPDRGNPKQIQRYQQESTGGRARAGPYFGQLPKQQASGVSKQLNRASYPGAGRGTRAKINSLSWRNFLALQVAHVAICKSQRSPSMSEPRTPSSCVPNLAEYQKCAYVGIVKHSGNQLSDQHSAL